jgi:hypothetical protein
MHALAFPYLSYLSAYNSSRACDYIFMKFRIGEFYKRLSTDMNFGCWISIVDVEDFEVSGFVEGSNGLGCVAGCFPSFLKNECLTRSKNPTKC